MQYFSTKEGEFWCHICSFYVWLRLWAPYTAYPSIKILVCTWILTYTNLLNRVNFGQLDIPECISPRPEGRCDGVLEYTKYLRSSYLWEMAFLFSCISYLLLCMNILVGSKKALLGMFSAIVPVEAGLSLQIMKPPMKTKWWIISQSPGAAQRRSQLGRSFTKPQPWLCHPLGRHWQEQSYWCVF